MAKETVYDDHVDFYVGFVDRVSETAPSKMTVDAILQELGDIRGLDICDLACGEGFLSRLLADHGASVRGFDASEKLIAIARERSKDAVEFAVSDAQELRGVDDDSFDVVVCHMAVMDIPDIDALFKTVRRVLNPSGRFILTVLHPCFETPFNSTTGGLVEKDAAGNFVACRVMRYRHEGLWESGGIGVRGHMGAFHRKLSTYLNSLISAGHQITKLLEPMLPEETYDDVNQQWAMMIPRRLTICSIV